MFDLYDNDFEKAFDEAVDAIEKKEHRLIWADALKRHYAWWEGGTREMTMDEAKNDFDTIIDLQPTVEVEPNTAIETVDWYHQNADGEMVLGANSNQQAWFKADDVFKALKAEPSKLKEVIEPYREFCKWVAEWIFKEDFEESAGSFAELACRRLAKLGYVFKDGEYWTMGEVTE